jgi:aspartate aminotransferase-like enzyme
MSDFGTFFLPGPTEVRREILEAMLQPMLPHRGAAFEALYDRVDQGLRPVFRTQRPVFIGSCSATGLMEAAVRCAPPGPILALVNGAFSQRFADIARACDRETRVLQVPLGETHTLEAVDAALTAQWHAAMTVVHSETSTGALQDVAALAAVAHRHGTAILVDSVTGIGGAPVETDAWQLDFVLTGSQKALALPPGLAFGVASESFILQAQTATAKGLYFDLVEFEEYAHKRQTPNAPRSDAARRAGLV